jgi:hypothetical protein
MSHLDEGTLHALLDGELSANDAREVQGHLGTCAACGSRLQEVKQFLAEADRLVGALEVPVGPPASAPSALPHSRPSPPPTREFREPEMWNEPPVLLLPDNAEALARRRRWISISRWAAIIAVVVVGGRGLFSVINPGTNLPAARDITTATRAVPPAVASPQETRQPAAPPQKAAARAPTQNRNLATRTPAPQPKAAAPAAVIDTAAQGYDSASSALSDSMVADTQTLAAASGASTDSASADSASTDSAPKQSQARPTARADDDLATRRAAGEALAELDRQRRKERAAAATAALESRAPARTETAPAEAAPPPPAPRTPEQRSQIYMRIGLDEAVKQLGGPVHVIEGMTPEFIGLINGRLVPGADATRPVVRVVYMDSRARLILLDQQRLRPGQAAPGASDGNLRWSVGDVMLYLRGEPTPDVLRNLQRRVR